MPRHSRNRDRASPAEPACDICGHAAHHFAELPTAYAYLLGLYLGDGCISEHARQVFRLRVFLDLRYPLIIDECEAAIRAVLPGKKVRRAGRTGGYVRRTEPSHVEVSAFSKAVNSYVD